MQKDYTGTKTVIVGGTHGMGLATARMLADGGGQVLVTGRNSANVAAANRVLSPRGEAMVSDVAARADIETLAKHAEARLHSLDLLFVNVGVSELSPLADITRPTWRPSALSKSPSSCRDCRRQAAARLVSWSASRASPCRTC